jgi:glyoxylase-like metal-dependent hydrolase (beta-lactamase superfamily II)
MTLNKPSAGPAGFPAGSAAAVSPMEVPMSYFNLYPLNCGTLIRGSERVGLHFQPGVPFTYPVIAWYLTDGRHKLMIDNGGPVECAIKQPYQVTEEQRLERQLANVGVRPEEIEAVIITHLHWDHTFNNDLFPKARFYLQKRELEYAAAPLPIHKDTYFHLEKIIKTDYVLLEGDQEIVPGVRAVFTPGHTPGSQSVAVDTADGVFVLISDLTNLAAFWEAEPKVPNGVHHDLSDTFRSFDRVAAIADYVLTGHEPKIFDYRSFPNGRFPRREKRGL